MILESVGGGRERKINLLFHSFMHSLVESCMCPDLGLEPQPWRIGKTLSPTELLGRGNFLLLFVGHSFGVDTEIPRVFSPTTPFYTHVGGTDRPAGKNGPPWRVSGGRQSPSGLVETEIACSPHLLASSTYVHVFTDLVSLWA